MSLIKLENVTKYYNGSGGIGLGIRKVNLSFDLGEFVVITGSSGSGKTTLLNVISGMDSYEEGVIYINNEDTSYYGIQDYEQYRRNYISFVFQNYNLIDSFTVFQNVELALVARGMSKKERRNRVNQIIEQVGLKKRSNHRATKLSGGEKQRVAIARALASDAPIIACDEITGNLDHQTSLEIIQLLKKVSKGKLVLIVSHDIEEVINEATRVIVMHDGGVDKDYFVNNQIFATDLNINLAQSVSFKENIKLGIQVILSTPRKFILMFIVFFFIAFLVLLVYSGYNVLTNVNMSDNNSLFNNKCENRIILKKTDSSSFSEQEIDVIGNVNKVKTIFNYDVVFDRLYLFNLYNADTNIKMGDQNFLLLPIEQTNKSELEIGRMPQNEFEVILAIPYVDYASDYVNKVFKYHDETFQIVGVIESIDNSQSYIYGTNLFLQKFIAEALLFSNNVSSSNIELSLELNRLLQGYTKYVRYNNSHIQINGNLQDVTIPNSNLIFTNTYTEHPFYNIDIRVNNRYQKEQFDNIYYDTVIYLPEIIYDKLIIEEIFQISIFVDNTRSVKEVVGNLEKLGYYAYPIFNWNDANISITILLESILKVSLLFFIIILFIGVISISSLIIRNVIKSMNKPFLIMRSLGMDGKSIKIQLYIQLFFTMLIASVFTIVLYILSISFKIKFLSTSIGQLSVLQLAMSILVVLLLSIILAQRYCQTIISSSIVSKEME